VTHVFFDVAFRYALWFGEGVRRIVAHSCEGKCAPVSLLKKPNLRLFAFENSG